MVPTDKVVRNTAEQARRRRQQGRGRLATRYCRWARTLFPINPFLRHIPHRCPPYIASCGKPTNLPSVDQNTVLSFTLCGLLNLLKRKAWHPDALCQRLDFWGFWDQLRSTGQSTWSPSPLRRARHQRHQRHQRQRHQRDRRQLFGDDTDDDDDGDIDDGDIDDTYDDTNGQSMPTGNLYLVWVSCIV